MIDKLMLMSGVDIPIPEFQATLHQPTLKEIGMMGEHNFFQALQIFCIDTSQLANQKSMNISNFELFMAFLKEQPDKKDNIINFCTIIFPNYKLLITPLSLVFNGTNNSFTIDKETFNKLQELLKAICRVKFGDNDFNPQSEKAQEIANKLMRARKRVAAQKQASEGESSLAQYISVLTIAVSSMSLQNILSLSLYQMYDLMERYNLYLAWDIDLRSRMAGAKIDKKPENWMKSLS